MANHVRHIRRLANGIDYYERRLPRALGDRPADWNALFGGKTRRGVSRLMCPDTLKKKVGLIRAAIFVERVAKAGHDRLFFDWQAPAGRVDAGATAWANASLIRSFNRTVVPQQLWSLLIEGARQEVTFHSFRGAFKTLLGRSEYNLPDNYKHEVIGHAKSALDKRYVQKIPLADTYPAIRGCAYMGLQLPISP